MKMRDKDFIIQELIILLTLLSIFFVIAAFTGMWPWKDNDYNSYALQAHSWLQGRLDLGQDYPWLELAIYEGKYFVSFPPFPSYVLLPFSLFIGTATPDHFIALAMTLVGATYALKLYREVMGSKKNAEYFVLMLYLASGYLFVGMNGYVWFIAQSMSFTLALMSLYYAVKGKGGWSLAFWACAVGCRPMLALYGVLLVYILWKGWKKEYLDRSLWKKDYLRGSIWEMIKSKWYWGIGVGTIVLSYMILNYARFGSIVEFGHNYLPEFTRTKTGQFNFVYLLGNLKNYLRLPEISEDHGPLHFFTADGMAFWLIGPIFVTILIAWIYAMWKKRKGNLTVLILIPILVILHILIICCHRTLGGWQWGNRYLVDTMPFLFYGMLRWKPKGESFIKWNLPIFFFGFSINIVGTIATYNYWIS